MANVRNSNTFYVNTVASNALSTDAANLPILNIRVTHIVVSANGAGAIVQLGDVTTGNLKFDGRVATDGESVEFSFEANPLVFPNGIYVATCTNAIATCVIRETAG